MLSIFSRGTLRCRAAPVILVLFFMTTAYNLGLFLNILVCLFRSQLLFLGIVGGYLVLLVVNHILHLVAHFMP